MLHDLLDPQMLIKNFGYLGIGTTIFLESGVMVGFFLPGDSLLFTAGLVASQGYLSITALVILSSVTAIIGNNVGYATGRKLGPVLFSRPDSFLFSHDRVEEAHRFFDAQGAKSLVLARFLPVVRTFVPIIAGVAKMRYRTFLFFNMIGGILWGAGVAMLGYFLGRTIPNIDKYLLPAVMVIILLSLLPGVWALIQSRRHKAIRKAAREADRSNS